MMRAILLFLAVCAVLVGCGGGGGGGNNNFVGFGDVSGVIYDASGNLVRNAQVYYAGGPGSTLQTVSNSNGAYILKGIPAFENDLIQCQITSGGVSYYGQNLANVQNGQRTATLNIAMYPASQEASIHGTVSDSLGNLLAGAKIYAIPASGKLLTSAYGLTDNTGHYAVGGLLAGVAYNIQVNGLGYNSATDTQTLNTGEDRLLTYTINAAATSTLQPPTGVKATAFTSPGEATSTPRLRNAMEAVKNLVNPSRRLMRPMVHKGKKRPTTLDGTSPIEVDVFWTPINNVSLLGFGIYRTTGGVPLTNIDFLSDPQASVYEDMDAALTSGTTYTYGTTTISTGFNSTTGESTMSNTATVTPLGPLALGSVTASAQPTFTWSPATGAANYSILLFSTYPDIGVTDIFDNLSSPVSGTSYTYTGTALTSGQTYYYIVIGFSATGDQSISTVGQFAVP